MLMFIYPRTFDLFLGWLIVLTIVAWLVIGTIEHVSHWYYKARGKT